MNHLIIKTTDDWVRLEYNGRVVFDGHSFHDCHLEYLFNALGLNIVVEIKDVSEDELQ